MVDHMSEHEYPRPPESQPAQSDPQAGDEASTGGYPNPFASPNDQPTNSYPSVDPGANRYPPGQQAGAQFPPAEHQTNVYESAQRYPGDFEPAQQHTSVYPPPPSGPPYQPFGAPFYEAHPPHYGQPNFAPPVPGSDASQSRPRRRGGSLIAVAAVAAVIGGVVGAGTVAIADHHNGSSVNTGLKITNATGAPTAQLNGTISAAAAKIRPSVVTIDVVSGQSEGTGSGVILRADGYVLTNDHVVSLDGTSTSGKITVTLTDGRSATGRVVGEDPSDDLAVVKVDGLSNLTPATFGKSSSLTVGQSVVAVGAPLGLSDTVTSGIVSNTARPVRAGNNNLAVFEAVQTDAAINPGNSGGPLVDLNGSVVGINAAIATDSSGGGLQIPGQPVQQSGNIGIGFAIPSDEASRIASELIATGKATHAVIGVSVGGQNQNNPTAGTPIVSKVDASGPAAKAGIQAGDTITLVDNQRVVTADALIAAIRSHAPGDTVTLTFTRAGTTKTASVTLGSANS
jgi:putative serine protease PepD